MPEPHFPQLHRAILFAAKRHRDQDRDGEAPPPYITHPIDVVVKLRYVGRIVGEDLLCAGALHDVVEECGVDPGKIGRRFGPRVETLVRQVTREEPSEEQARGMDRDALWTLRSEMLLAEIAQRMEPDAWRIKLADRLSNLQEALSSRTGEKRDRYVRQTRRILEIIPRETNPGLWDAVAALAAE